MTKEKLFKIALAIASMTMAEFARKHNVTRVMIHRNIKGQSKSRRIEKAIDAFIDQQLQKMNIQCNYKKVA